MMQESKPNPAKVPSLHSLAKRGCNSPDRCGPAGRRSCGAFPWEWLGRSLALPRFAKDWSPSWILSLLLAIAPLSRAADPPEQQPPPAQGKIDFDHDIRPIFETTCLRCHGPEKPKSHFRLDNRESALKGGSDGVDILPGSGAKSPLVQRVSSTNEDMRMPPPGKGEALTPAQIGKLQAWIDQGAAWGATNSGPQFHFDLQPQFDWIGVHGDKGEFRQIEGIMDGPSGGLKHFSFEDQIDPTEKLSLQGHFLSAGQESGLQLNLTKNDVGFIRAGFEQLRQYYDNFGWHDSAATQPGLPAAASLSLDEGRAWIDLGLTLPRGPQLVLGYEEQFRVGDESTLDWGALGAKNIAPSTEAVDEHTHIIKLDVTGELAGWQVQDNARVEIHTSHNGDNEITGPGATFQTQDKYNDVQGMNTLSLEKTVRDWWSVSAAYYYAHLEGDDSLNQAGTPPGTVFQFWQSPQVTLSTASHIFSASSLFRPIASLTFGLSTQFEWTHERGFGAINTAFPVAVVGPFTNAPVQEDSNLDEFKSSQNAALRFTKIPWTVLFADARFEQDGNTSFQEGTVDGPDNPFASKWDAQNTEYDVRTGFTTSPRTWVSLNAEYRFHSSDTSYNHLIDSTQFSGYPAFITGRTIKTDAVETKLVLRPANWLRTTLSYKIEGTDYSTATDPVTGGISPGGPLLAGKYEAHTYGLSGALTPITRLNLTSTLTYSDSRTWSFANDDPSVAPYKGGVWMATEGAAFTLTQTTRLSASYSFSQANYRENNGTVGIPLGMDYTRHTAAIALTKRFSEKISGAVRYAFYTYAEPSSGGLTDYTAQGIFATLTFKGP
jgi:hypothetical protein